MNFNVFIIYLFIKNRFYYLKKKILCFKNEYFNIKENKY